jgi:hypothetical protein
MQNNFVIQSPLYNTKSDYFTKTITAITAPNIYFTKKIYSNLYGRCNTNFSYKSSFIDVTVITLDFPSNKDIYNIIIHNKNLSTAVGLQYHIKLKKFTLYPAIEYMGNVNWTTTNSYYTLQTNPNTSEVDVFKKVNYINTINVLAGMAYQFQKKWSCGYEMGYYQDAFSIILFHTVLPFIASVNYFSFLCNN